MVCRFSCSVACGISPDQGLNLCLLPWWVDSYPLCHQGSPLTCFNPEPLVLLKKSHTKGFPGGPVVWTLHFYCKGHEFNPWSGNSDSVSLVMQTKKKKSHTRSGLWKGKEVKQREIFETKIETPLPWPPWHCPQQAEWPQAGVPIYGLLSSQLTSGWAGLPDSLTFTPPTTTFTGAEVITHQLDPFCASFLAQDLHLWVCWSFAKGQQALIREKSMVHPPDSKSRSWMPGSNFASLCEFSGCPQHSW